MVRFYIVVNITAIKCGNVTYLPFPLLCASGTIRQIIQTSYLIPGSFYIISNSSHFFTFYPFYPCIPSHRVLLLGIILRTLLLFIYTIYLTLESSIVCAT